MSTKQDTTKPDHRCAIRGSYRISAGGGCIPCHDDYSPHREPPDETAKEESDE